MEKNLVNNDDLLDLCNNVRLLYNKKSIDECKEMICEAMKNYPHSAVPHNLMGLVLQKTGHLPKAMNHFRAAWALEPTYLPARHNLEYFGASFFKKGKIAFDESDCN